jgi:hypothetical protein
LEKKLNHCLDLKINYGYFEFFSSTYFPYTLSGLLNLVDFAKDPVIKQKAILATERLLKEALLLVNDKGTFFPAAGRNYSGKYTSAYDQNHNNLIYLLTGLGQKQTAASHSGAFLSSSTLDVKSIVESWKSKEDLNLKIGFTLKEGFEIHKDLLKEDRIIFQWSGGGYFDPEVAYQTFNLIDRYNLWDHKEFKSFKVFKDIPASLTPKAAKAASAISTSSVISNQTVSIFKNNEVTLASIPDYFKGCNGYQQWPWCANVGTSAVLTFSGEAKSIFNEDINANSTLPYIDQKSNVALIMYRAKKELALFGFENHAVSMLWETDKFDEVAFNGKWIIGREGNGYVAVLRHCTDTLNGIYSCDDQDGQLWGVIVGNSEMHGSFENFKNIVAQAKYQEKWIYNKNRKEWIYYGMINVDGKFIEHNWVENYLSAPADSTTEQPIPTSIKYLENTNEGFTLYPNPAKGRFTIAFESPISGNYNVRIHDITGRQMYFRTMDSNITPAIQVGTEGWPIGLYTVIVETNEGIMSRKIMVQQ